MFRDKRTIQLFTHPKFNYPSIQPFAKNSKNCPLQVEDSLSIRSKSEKILFLNLTKQKI